MTPKELYEKMQNGEDVSGQMSTVHTMFAKAILRRQAGELAKERCVERICFAEDDANPWSLAVMFTNGELSEAAQSTLVKMRSNAHDTKLMTGDSKSTLMFFVYSSEADA